MRQNPATPEVGRARGGGTNFRSSRESDCLQRHTLSRATSRRGVASERTRHHHRTVWHQTGTSHVHAGREAQARELRGTNPHPRPNENTGAAVEAARKEESMGRGGGIERSAVNGWFASRVGAQQQRCAPADRRRPSSCHCAPGPTVTARGGLSSDRPRRARRCVARPGRRRRPGPSPRWPSFCHAPRRP
jgi:hypothetical protein